MPFKALLFSITKFTPCRFLVSLLLAAFSVGSAYADALVVTQAMKASTIVEIFVESDEIRFEMELGASDLEVFADCLPDPLYERVTGKSEPMPSRLSRFLDQELVVVADENRLPGKLESIEVARRVTRDEVTGDPVNEEPSERTDQQTSEATPGANSDSNEDPSEPPIVLRLKFVFPLETLPRTLSIRPPGVATGKVADIGFVCYHRGLPVNDFRYLTSEVTLDLDWEDPWYSRFRHRNLWRRYDAPVSVYLYVEPYEVRKEIIVRPRDLSDTLGFEFPDEMIRVDQQDAIKRRVGEFLLENSPVEIDGKRIAGRLDRIHFIRRSLRTTGVIEPPVDLDATSATLGVIVVYPVDQLPEEVTMKCELFTPKISSIPGVASDEAGGLPSILTPDDPVLVWKNYLTNPSDASLIRVETPPAQAFISIPAWTLACGILAIAMGGVTLQRRRESRQRAVPPFLMMVAAITLGVLGIPFGRFTVNHPFAEEQSISDSEASQVLSALLYNVYRSFDHHDERLIYDRLAKSISGDLLETVYLDTRQSMEVKNQGGLRISVKKVDVKDLERTERVGSEQTYLCRWQVSGWIGHWGHIHSRDNEHLAEITLSDQDGEWRITSMTTLDASPTENQSTREQTESGDA